MNLIPRLGTGLCGNRTETTAGQSEESEGSTGQLKGQKSLQIEGPTVIDYSLAHAGRAIKAGRSYLCRLINLSNTTRRLDQF